MTVTGVDLEMVGAPNPPVSSRCFVSEAIQDMLSVDESGQTVVLTAMISVVIIVV